MNALVLSMLVAGQCSNCPRFIPQSVQPIVQAARYEWKIYPDHAALYQNGTHVGSYAKGRYHPWNGVSWGEPFPSRDQEPLIGQAVIIDGKPGFNYGVDTDKIHDKTTFGDTEGIPNDTSKYRVTVRSGDKALTDSIVKSFDTVKDKVLIQTYPPGHWALAPGLDFGLLHVQSPPRPDGKAVLVHSQPDWASGDTATVLRKVDPAFNAEAVPDLRKNVSPTDDIWKWLQSPSPVGGLAWWIVLGGGGLLAYKFKDKWNPPPKDTGVAVAELRTKRGLK